jgi:hypothetical protein
MKRGESRRSRVAWAVAGHPELGNDQHGAAEGGRPKSAERATPKLQKVLELLEPVRESVPTTGM